MYLRLYKNPSGPSPQNLEELAGKQKWIFPCKCKCSKRTRYYSRLAKLVYPKTHLTIDEYCQSLAAKYLYCTLLLVIQKFNNHIQKATSEISPSPNNTIKNKLVKKNGTLIYIYRTTRDACSVNNLRLIQTCCRTGQ